MSTLLRNSDKEQYDSLSDKAKVRYNQFRFIANLRMERWLGANWRSAEPAPETTYDSLNAQWKELEKDNLPQLQN